MFVLSSHADPPLWGGDRTDDLSRAVDREIVDEDGAAGRLAHGFGDVFQFLHHLDPDRIAPCRCRIDVDQGEFSIGLQGGLEAIIEGRRVRTPRPTIVPVIWLSVRIVPASRFSVWIGKYLLTTMADFFQTSSKSVDGTIIGLRRGSRAAKIRSKLGALHVIGPEVQPL